MKNSFRYYLLAIIVLLIFNIKTTANNIDEYFENMYSGKYKNVSKILYQMKINSPNSIRTKIAFANFYLVMFETSGELEKYNVLCKKEADYVNNVLSKKKKLNVDDVYYMVSAKAIILKIQFRRKQYLKAAKNLRTIIKLFEFAINHEGHPKMRLISGMYNYYIETAKIDYPIAYPILIFFPNGNKEKGLQLLFECTKEKDKTISIRSKLYLANIYRRDEKNYSKSKYWFKQLLNKYPNNILWMSDYINMLREYNKNIEANAQKDILLKIVSETKQLTEEQKIYLKNL